VSAVKILLDVDSALQDVELPSIESLPLNRGERRRVIGLPILPEDSVKDNIMRTREYGLILTVVQAVTRHERDLVEEQIERAEAERKKADNSTDSLPALAEEKKVKAGRRRARQDLRVSAWHDAFCAAYLFMHNHSPRMSTSAFDEQSAPSDLKWLKFAATFCRRDVAQIYRLGDRRLAV
jgi:hypothetical protein